MATFRLRQNAPGRVELRASPVSALLGTVMMTGFGVVLLVRELSGGPVDDADDVVELVLAAFCFVAALGYLANAVAKLVRPRVVADAAGVGPRGEQVPWSTVAGLRPAAPQRLEVSRYGGGPPLVLTWADGVTSGEVASAFAGCAATYGHHVAVRTG